MLTQSYAPDTFHASRASELARLSAQIDLSWRQEARLLHWVGLQDGMRVAELGCGPGLVAERLQAGWSNLSLTLVDADPSLLQLAQERLTHSPPEQMVLASAENTDLPANQFDFIIARYLFQHVADPVVVAREALRLLKPGGRFVIIDLDDMLWGIAEPAQPKSATIFAKAAQAQADRGGDRFIGRKLPNILSQAGFASVELDPFAYHSDALGLAPFLPQMHPDRLTPALFAGALSLYEFAQAQAMYRQFANDPNAFVLMLGLMAHGVKGR